MESSKIEETQRSRMKSYIKTKTISLNFITHYVVPFIFSSILQLAHRPEDFQISRLISKDKYSDVKPQMMTLERFRACIEYSSGYDH